MEEDEIFGEEVKEKEGHIVQINFMNMGGLPLYNVHHENVEMRKLVKELKVDVLGLLEVNVNWLHNPAKHRLGEWTLTL